MTSSCISCCSRGWSEWKEEHEEQVKSREENDGAPVSEDWKGGAYVKRWAWLIIMSCVSDWVAVLLPLLSARGAITWDLPPIFPPSRLSLFSLQSFIFHVVSLYHFIPSFPFHSLHSTSVPMAIVGSECKCMVNIMGRDPGLDGDPGVIKHCLSQHIFSLTGVQMRRCSKDKDRGGWEVTGLSVYGPRGHQAAALYKPGAFLDSSFIPSIYYAQQRNTNKVKCLLKDKASNSWLSVLIQWIKL